MLLNKFNFIRYVYRHESSPTEIHFEIGSVFVGVSHDNAAGKEALVIYSCFPPTLLVNFFPSFTWFAFDLLENFPPYFSHFLSTPLEYLSRGSTSVDEVRSKSFDIDQSNKSLTGSSFFTGIPVFLIHGTIITVPLTFATISGVFLPDFFSARISMNRFEVEAALQVQYFSIGGEGAISWPQNLSRFEVSAC